MKHITPLPFKIILMVLTMLTSFACSKKHADALAGNETQQFSSYQSILDTYSEKIKAATPILIEEYKTEASKNIGGIEGLAKLSNDKISKLAKISNEGVAEMAKVMYRTGPGKYSEYQSWGAKLTELYMSEGAKITDVYMKSAL